MQRLSGGLVPNNSGLTLISDADGNNLLARVTLLLKLLNSTINTGLYRGDELLRVMLMPTKPYYKLISSSPIKVVCTKRYLPRMRIVLLKL